MKKGYTCKCGKYNAFDVYVFAHWDIPLTHACECGRKNTIMRGVVSIGRKNRGNKKNVENKK